MNLLDNTPTFTVAEAIEIATEQFGVEVETCRLLASERDQNFHIVSEERTQFVLKIANGQESRSFLDGQNAMMNHLAERIDVSPTVVESTSGNSVDSVELSGADFLVRMVTFVAGQSMAELKFVSDQLLSDIGHRVAEMDLALNDFDHPSFHRDFHWDLANAETVVLERIHLIEDLILRTQVETLLKRFRKHTKPFLGELPKSVIHSDVNDGNIVVCKPNENELYATRVNGFIDFGDAVYTWTVADLAIAIAYSILEQPDPLRTAGTILDSYHKVHALTDAEISALYGLVCLRLCASVSIAAEQIEAQPDNEYLLVSQIPIRNTLPKLSEISFRFAEYYFRNVTGLVKNSGANEMKAWLLENQSTFAFPVNPETRGEKPAAAKTLVLDLGVESPLIPLDVDNISEPTLTKIVFDEMERNDATVAIGRYLEPRLLYSSSHFVGDDISKECRTVHLGIDIFAKAGTPVVAPISGEVYFAGVIDKPLDYGGLIVLMHRPNSGGIFYTLYGHLDPESFGELKPGQSIERGQTIATLGEPKVNGGWTPHVHFQLMLDLLGLGHEFPGVAYASQADVWSAISPDPNLILGIDEKCFPVARPSKQQTLNERQRRIGPSLSVGYDDPIKVVRGWKQYLFDETGRRYLDAYNNVPHVGHSHPKVVDAVNQQMRLLNTNTRYLHDNIVELSHRITDTMPDGLDVCYFLNSASEANELALRLARQFTNAKDMLVLDSAYHGNSTTLIEISPYKHDGPAGLGAPNWVHTVPIADTYRGKHRNLETATSDYVLEVASAIDILDRPLCGFIFESCPSVAGQIIFPKGYLRSAAELVRNAKGLVIADDVQTGFGRLGSHMYGFQLDGITPDIVILGKPIGNGHPLSAVVTNREIAERFNNGMEFFSTFGGNPVSCAAGLAVLDVLRDENLMDNAECVGTQLLEGLRELQKRFNVIGDVRGRGFFLGVDLVKDRATRHPNRAAAKFISNRMRQRSVLLGTDGPFHNVLKIRPPMCFDNKNVEQLLHQLEACLAELPG